MIDRNTRSVLVTLVVVAMLATAVPVAGAVSDEVPIRERMVGYTTGLAYSPSFPAGDTFDGRCSQPSQWITSMSGSGNISHLGQVTWTSEHCFQLPGTFGDADLVITAANGDILYGTYDGWMTGETTFAETMIITGGTGRFAGASGTADETGWFDPVTGYMEIAGIGSILYDASNRSAGS